MLAAGICHAQVALPNPGFENWESIGVYEEPTDWNSANECSDQISIYAVGKSTDAHSGSFSARMVTQDLGGIIKINGVITTSTMICIPPYGITGGTSYDQRPDSIVGWYKYAAVGLDTGYAQVIIFNGNDTIGYAKAPTWGITSVWTRFSAPIVYTSTQAATMASILFNSSWGNGNENQGFAGSELLVDDIELIFNSVGINDDTRTAGWSIYPNPTAGALYIESSGSEDAFLEILNITGKRMVYERVGQMASKLDLSELVAGVYLYQLRSLEDQLIRTGKLVVQP